MTRTVGATVSKARFVVGAARPEAFPNWDLPEVAFAGRSNVGKSSALKLLTAGRCAVRVSKTPGRTREINFFELTLVGGRRLSFVDLPGYGFAAVAPALQRHWARLVEAYLSNRPNLKLLVLLCDLRRGPEEEEDSLVEWLEQLGVAWRLLCTKADKLPKNKRVPAAQRAAGRLGAKRPILFSGRTGLGRDELWAAILRATSEPAS